MNKFFVFVVQTVFATAIVGCSVVESRQVGVQNCTSDWYVLVEKKIPTGDGQGHGPDMGSAEWRSVVEFKLGIRGNVDIPFLESEQWCSYINKHYIETTK